MIGYDDNFTESISEHAYERQKRLEKVVGLDFDTDIELDNMDGGITHQEYIQTCSTEELAVMLVTYVLYPMEFKPYKKYLKKCSDGLTEKDFVDMAIKWLKKKK